MSDNDKVISLADARGKERTAEKTEKVEKTEAVDNTEAVFCSFCGRPNYLVLKMIKGPGVNICSECIMICLQYLIMEDKIPSNEAQKALDAFWQGIKKQ